MLQINNNNNLSYLYSANIYANIIKCAVKRINAHCLKVSENAGGFGGISVEIPSRVGGNFISILGKISLGDPPKFQARFLARILGGIIRHKDNKYMFSDDYPVENTVVFL